MEIERKYFIKQVPFSLDDYQSVKIHQGYICPSPVIRIRKAGDDFYLTCKGKGRLARDEWEIKITEDEYKYLYTKADGGFIQKTRYFIPLKQGSNETKLIIELDIFKGKLKGLIIAEVEFETLKQANNFTPPKWFGTELTFKKGYSNNKLRNLTRKQSLELINKLNRKT